MADRLSAAAMERERGRTGGRIEPQSQRADRHVHRSPSRIEWVADKGAQAWLVVLAKDSRGVLMRARFADIDPIEVATRAEHQVWRSRQISLDRPVPRPVLERLRRRQ